MTDRNKNFLDSVTNKEKAIAAAKAAKILANSPYKRKLSKKVKRDIRKSGNNLPIIKRKRILTESRVRQISNSRSIPKDYNSILKVNR